MDEEKAKKFLSHADFARLDCIHYSDMSLGALNTLYENAKHRHKHRAELLGIVDRLLATTAGYAAQVETLGNGVNAYAAFGDLKPWFGGPQAGLTLKPGVYDRVFGTRNGVAWSFQSLVNRISWLESALDEAQALADKPMAILDDAQGYYTVTDPFDGNASITVKKLAQRNVRQRDMLKEHDEAATRAKGRDREQSETIQRKNELLSTQQKRIDELEAQVRSVRSYSIAQNTISDLARALRSTQEDYGDVMVALMDAEERVEELRDRLGHIGAVACGDADVPVVGVDHGSSEGDQGVYFIDIEIPGAWGFMHKPGKKD